MKAIHIFKTGRHTDAGGTTIDFTEEDLAATVAAYDPTKHEAPIVVGHPKDNAPAFGWIKSLKFEEGNLTAEPDQVDPEFSELVQAGRYKKISASFYTPTSPANPVPGVYYLRHVGFLGAQPPAIKGLRGVVFAEDEEGVIEFRAPDSWDAKTAASLWRNLRDWLLGKFGTEDADKVVPSHMVSDLETSATMPEPRPEPINSPALPAFSEEDAMTKELQEKLDAALARITALESENATLKTENANYAEQAKKARRADTEAAIDKAIAEGKVLPSEKARLMAFAESIAGAAEVSFGEGDQAKKESPLAMFLADLAARAPRVDFQERAAADGAAIDGKTNEQIAQEALAYQEAMRQKGITISTTEAVKAVHAGKTA